MEMIQNVGINILAAIIYDVSKYLFGRSSDKRINLEKITKEFNQNLRKAMMYCMIQRNLIVYLKIRVLRI